MAAPRRRRAEVGQGRHRGDEGARVRVRGGGEQPRRRRRCSTMRPSNRMATSSASTDMSARSCEIRGRSGPSRARRSEQQAGDLGLDRRVEAGEGLVQDQQPRLHGQRAGDGEPLPLAAAEIEGPAVAASPRESPTLSISSSARCRRSRRARRGRGCRAARRTISAARQTRIERGRRVLEDELDALAERAQARAAAAASTSSPSNQISPPVGLLEPGQAPRERRLAGAGLADQRHDRARARASRSTPARASTRRVRRVRAGARRSRVRPRTRTSGALSLHAGRSGRGGRPRAASPRARVSRQSGRRSAQRGSNAQPRVRSSRVGRRPGDRRTERQRGRPAVAGRG